MRWTVAFPMFPADHLLPMASRADDAGFDTITVPDSVFFPERVDTDYPYSGDGSRFWSGDTPFVDPFISIAAMAAVTERIRYLTNVVKLPIRDPLLVAKQLSSMAVLSGERVGLGVGLSWMPRVRWRRPAVGGVPRSALRLRPADDLPRAGAPGADLGRRPLGARAEARRAPR